MRSSASLPPLRFRNCTFASYDASASPTSGRALELAQELAAGRIRTLVLIGSAGVGKTHLAAATCRAFREAISATHRTAVEAYDRQMSSGDHTGRRRLPYPLQAAGPMWCNVPELVVDLRSQMDQPLADREAASRARFLREHPGLVVLDDLGRERISEWTGELVYTLINGRYERELPTIATSNLTSRELQTSGYWPAVSRLAQDGYIVEITAPDRRLARAAS